MAGAATQSYGQRNCRSGGVLTAWKSGRAVRSTEAAEWRTQGGRTDGWMEHGERRYAEDEFDVCLRRDQSRFGVTLDDVERMRGRREVERVEGCPEGGEEIERTCASWHCCYCHLFSSVLPFFLAHARTVLAKRGLVHLSQSLAQARQQRVGSGSAL